MWRWPGGLSAAGPSSEVNLAGSGWNPPKPHRLCRHSPCGGGMVTSSTIRSLRLMQQLRTAYGLQLAEAGEGSISAGVSHASPQPAGHLSALNVSLVE